MTEKEKTEKYSEVMEEQRLNQMKAYCDEYNINSYAEFIVYCSYNNTEWFRIASSYGGCRAMKCYFREKRKCREHNKKL